MTYRTGNHWGVTIVREGDPGRFCCNRGDHPGHSGDELVAVVVNGDQALAERICALLNGSDRQVSASISPQSDEHAPARDSGYAEVQTGAEDGPCVGLCAGCSPDCGLVGDSCSCSIVGPDPGCVVHHGRRARGPKPPPVGPGCICDGSGRTCPRHGAVL